MEGSCRERLRADFDCCDLHGQVHLVSPHRITALE